MSPIWLYRNVTEAWFYRASLADFWRRLRWVYAGKLPRMLRRDEQIIRFRFPPPLNQLTFLLRSNGGSDTFIFGEVFHHRYYDLPLNTPPATILDLGANAGFTATYFSRCFPEAKIACVEPHPGNVRILKRNCELNNVKAVIIAAAIATEDGEVIMEINRMDYGHRVVESPVSTPNVTLKVEAVTIPTLLIRLGWERVGLLKLDIEGYERVLFAADCSWLDRIDAMCIECHEGFSEEDLHRLGQRYGFLEPVRLPGIWFLGRN